MRHKIRMETPPATTLSTPSPTELHDQDPVAAEMNKIASRSKPIYLVVATTPCKVLASNGTSQARLGIGLNGQLPWPMIKADMSYFKQVTEQGGKPGSSTENTVIMGRKTYFSIPEKFRPLAKRCNIIVTRAGTAEVGKQVLDGMLARKRQAKAGSERLKLAEAVIKLENNDETNSHFISSNNRSFSQVHVCKSPETAIKLAEGQKSGIFCIGGSEVYSAFLQNTSLRPRLRVLQTEIQKIDGEDFECDTFWPEESSAANGWDEAKPSDVAAWTGIDLPQHNSDWTSDEKVGVRLRVRGWKQTAK